MNDPNWADIGQCIGTWVVGAAGVAFVIHQNVILTMQNKILSKQNELLENQRDLNQRLIERHDEERVERKAKSFLDKIQSQIRKNGGASVSDEELLHGINAVALQGMTEEDLLLVWFEMSQNYDDNEPLKNLVRTKISNGLRPLAGQFRARLLRTEECPVS
jgi:hypothetical protein